MQLARSPKISLVIAVCSFSVLMYGQTSYKAGSPTANPRIVQAIDERQLIQLKGQMHPLAALQNDSGAVPDNLPMEHMLFLLQRSPQQEAAAAQFIDQLHDPNSSKYQQWLTPQQFGEQFGPAQQDVAKVADWLRLHGFQVNTVYPNGLTIDISGTAPDTRHLSH